MRKTFKHEGYTFEEIAGIDGNPFGVKCYETGQVKYSAISYEDAVNLILSLIHFYEDTFKLDSEDEEYVKKVFKNLLIGKKLSEINDIVRDEIAGKKIHGKITCIERNKFDINQVYYTDEFKIIASCKRKNLRTVNNIAIQKRNK